MSYYHGGFKNGGVDWDYFDKFTELDVEYLPSRGEGETMATQIVTALCKLVYKWYNDGDVFDNTYTLKGWANDLSSYANWLDKYTGASFVLDGIEDCTKQEDYEVLLKDLCDLLYNEEYLSMMNKREKIGSIYKCDGRFEFCYECEDEEEYEEEYEEDEDDYDDEEEDEEEYDCEDEE